MASELYLPSQMQGSLERHPLLSPQLPSGGSARECPRPNPIHMLSQRLMGYHPTRSKLCNLCRRHLLDRRRAKSPILDHPSSTNSVVTRTLGRPMEPLLLPGQMCSNGSISKTSTPTGKPYPKQRAHPPGRMHENPGCHIHLIIHLGGTRGIPAHKSRQGGPVLKSLRITSEGRAHLPSSPNSTFNDQSDALIWISTVSGGSAVILQPSESRIFNSTKVSTRPSTHNTIPDCSSGGKRISSQQKFPDTRHSPLPQTHNMGQMVSLI